MACCRLVVDMSCHHLAYKFMFVATLVLVTRDVNVCMN